MWGRGRVRVIAASVLRDILADRLVSEGGGEVADAILQREDVYGSARPPAKSA